jgi:precorrin-6B methylase 2
MELATAYWASRTLLTANRLGVFPALAAGPLSSDAVATALGLAPRPTRLLLDACTALGLLEKDERGFRNHADSQIFLVPGSEAFLGNALRYAADMWDGWSRLDACVRGGGPQVATEAYSGSDQERTRNFVYGMHGRALGIARALVSVVDLKGRRRLLDVGGGPGTYSALFTRAEPGLRATVLDLPEVVALAGEILESMQACGNVDVLAGDYHTTAFPDGNDVVLISGVFHRETESTCRDFIRRAREALVPSGMLVVADVFTDGADSDTAFPALFGVNMMLSAPDGGVHADADVARWIEQAGFRRAECKSFPPPMPHRVVVGYR